MKGLLKNNFYAAWANAKVFVVFLFLFGAFTVAVVSQSLVIGFVLTGIIGFSVNAAAVTKNEFVSKWGKYKLTLPVRRADIIISLFLNLAAWMLAGMVFAVAVTGLSWLLHGCPFDNSIDMLSMFALGISMSLFTGALFFPLFYLGGEERSEVFLVISLLCAFGGVYALVRSADYVPLRSDSKIPGNGTAASHRVQLPAHWFGSDGLAADGADCP